MDRLVDRLPGSNFINRSDQALNEALRDLANNYNIPQDEDDDDDEDGDKDDDEDEDEDEDDRKRQAAVVFNPRQFVERLVSSHEEAIAEALGNGDAATRACVRRVVNSLVNRNAVSTIATRIQSIRQSISTLIRIGQFLRTRRTALAEAEFLQECVSRFIDIAFCSRCTESTPPLCFNTCNSLLRACYSPYYTTLNTQYARLWVVAERVIMFASSTVRSIYENEATLLDAGILVSEIIPLSCIYIY